MMPYFTENSCFLITNSRNVKFDSLCVMRKLMGLFEVL